MGQFDGFGAFNQSQQQAPQAQSTPQSNPYGGQMQAGVPNPNQGNSPLAGQQQYGSAVQAGLTQPYYAPNVPMGQATTYAGASDPQSIINQIYQAFMPGAQQQQGQLQDQLAAAGLAGGPAINATDVLSRNQSQGLGNALGSGIEFGLGQQQQAGLANMGAMNQMTGMNIQDIIGQNSQNAGIGNEYNMALIQALMGQNAQQTQALEAPYMANMGQGNPVNANNFPVQAGLGDAFGGLGQALGGMFGGNQYGGATGGNQSNNGMFTS